VKSTCKLPSSQGTDNQMHIGFMKSASGIHVATAKLLTGSGLHEEVKQMQVLLIHPVISCLSSNTSKTSN